MHKVACGVLIDIFTFDLCAFQRSLQGRTRFNLAYLINSDIWGKYYYYGHIKMSCISFLLEYLTSISVHSKDYGQCQANFVCQYLVNGDK